MDLVREAAAEVFSAVTTDNEARLRSASLETARFESITGGSTVKTDLEDGLLADFGPNTRELTARVVRELTRDASRPREAPHVAGEADKNALDIELRGEDKATLVVNCPVLEGPQAEPYASELVLNFVLVSRRWKLARFVARMRR